MSEPYPPPPPPPAQSPAKGQGKRPVIGFIITLVGSIIVILEALGYLYVGILGIISTAIGILIGVLGFIFALSSIFCGYRGYVETEKTKRNIYGMIPFFIGLFVMVISQQIYVTFVDEMLVIFSGGMLSIGGALVSAGK